MKALQKYSDQKNHWNSIFKGPQYEVATAAGRQKVADMIDSALSPENLTCDGELPRAEVARRYKFLTRCAQELKSIDPSVEIYEF